MACMPIFEYTFFGDFWTNWARKIVGAQETIRNQGFEAYFSFFIFWDTFGGKIGVATTRAPDDLGPQNPTTKLAHWVDFLGRLLSRKCVFKIFSPEPPLTRLN